jgi:dTDP-4-amino-4,6-dideoxygalactose transaminase
MKEIGSEFSLSVEKGNYFSKINSLGEKNTFLRCGRDAIGLVAELLETQTHIILIPSYCCDAMVQPFVSRGWDVEYYPIMDNFSTDIQYLISLIKRKKPDAVLIMNFFGVSDTHQIVDRIRSENSSIQIIEDVTHILFDFDKAYSDKIDYYVGSVRKWMGIVDGGLVVSNKKSILKVKFKESEFVTLRREAFKIKQQYNSMSESLIKDRFRRLFLDAEKSLNNEVEPLSISVESKKLIDSYNYSLMVKTRKKNARVLIKLLKLIPHIRLPYNFDILLESTPFSVPILVKGRDKLQSELARKGVYLSVLWPLNEKSRKISHFSAELEGSMLSIPVDQRYTPEDMKYICKLLNEYFQAKK